MNILYYKVINIIFCTNIDRYISDSKRSRLDVFRNSKRFFCGIETSRPKDESFDWLLMKHGQRRKTAIGDRRRKPLWFAIDVFCCLSINRCQTTEINRLYIRVSACMSSNHNLSCTTCFYHRRALNNILPTLRE